MELQSFKFKFIFYYINPILIYKKCKFCNGNNLFKHLKCFHTTNAKTEYFVHFVLIYLCVILVLNIINNLNVNLKTFLRLASILYCGSFQIQLMALTSTRFRKFSFTKVEDPSSCLFTGTHRRAFLFLHFYAYHRRSAFPAKHLSGRRISGFLYPHIFLFVSLICCAYFRRYFLFP